MATSYDLTTNDGHHKMKTKAARVQVVRGYLCTDCNEASETEDDCVGSACGAGSGMSTSEPESNEDE